MLAKELAALLMQTPDLPVVKVCPDGNVWHIQGLNIVRLVEGEVYLQCEDKLLMAAIMRTNVNLSEETKQAIINAIPLVVNL